MDRVATWRTRLGLDERLALWLGLCVFGFMWVSVVQCGRAHPLLDRAGGFTQFVWMLLFAIVVYPVGPRCVLRAWHAEGARAMGINLLGYVLPFFIGLQFFYLQRIDAINYSLNYHDFARMGVTGMVVFSLLGLLVLGLLALHLRWARQAGLLAWYAGGVAASVVVIVGVAFLLRETHHVHIHHWFLGAYFVPFCRFRKPVSMSVQAVCAAIAVEGIAEWGMAPIWERN